MDDNFPWEDLLDYIQDGKVMPVLGHELIQADYQGRQVSLQRLLAERLADREKLTVEWTRHFELNDAVCAYLAHPESKLGVLTIASPDSSDRWRPRSRSPTPCVVSPRSAPSTCSPASPSTR